MRLRTLGRPKNGLRKSKDQWQPQGFALLVLSVCFKKMHGTATARGWQSKCYPIVSFRTEICSYGSVGVKANGTKRAVAWAKGPSFLHER